MAILWMDGFDDYTSQADASLKYSFPSSRPETIGVGTGRRGGNCAHSNGNNGFTKFLSPGDATCIVGVAWNPTTNLANNRIFRVLDANSVVHVQVNTRVDGSLEAFRGPGTTSLGVSATGVVTTGRYHALEFKVTVNDSTGVVIVKVDGATVLNLTGQDTRNAGLLGWSQVELFCPNGAPTNWDDYWICDGTGSINNDFKGDMRVDAHFPNANGNSNQSTPSTGTDRYATIDEAAPNGDTDYNTITNVGDKDTVNIQPLANSGATPDAVQISLYAKKTDAGAAEICPVLRQDGVDYDGTSKIVGESYGYFTQQYELAPDGTPWTEADFNALEVGYKRTA